MPRFVGSRQEEQTDAPCTVLGVMDYVGPALAALRFIAGMSLVKEPTRRTLNAIVVAGASGAYLSGGFGLWELMYPIAGKPSRTGAYGRTATLASPG